MQAAAVVKRGSASLRRLEKQIDTQGRDLEAVISSLLKSLNLLIESIADLQAVVRERLPIWGEDKLKPRKAKNLVH
jgi:hypothetical protein